MVFLIYFLNLFLLLNNRYEYWAWGLLPPSLGSTKILTYEKPIKVDYFSEFIELDGYPLLWAGLKEDGSVWEWGLKDKGYLGIKKRDERIIEPKRVEGIPKIVQICVKDKVIALDEKGNVWIGLFSYYKDTYELQKISKEGKNFPVKVEKLSNIMEISCGKDFSLALRKDGKVFVWGKNEAILKATNKDIISPYEFEGEDRMPFEVLKINEITKISAGSSHALALRRDGKVFIWGNHLGIEFQENSPKEVKGLENVKAISAGNGHSLALKEDGSVWIWGGNSYGQLGNGSKKNSLVPIKVENLPKIKKISAGGTCPYSIALDEEGNVWVWGCNNFGQLGDGSKEDLLSPKKLKGIKNVISIKTNFNTTIAKVEK